MTLDQIRARLNAATPGPWVHDEDGFMGCGQVYTANEDIFGCNIAAPSGDLYPRSGYSPKDDMVFIAAAPTDISALLNAVDAGIARMEDRARSLTETAERLSKFRVSRHGSTKPPRQVTPNAVRFWRNVVMNGDCWEWQRSKNKGYGQFRLNPENRPILAHRFAYEHMVAEIPEGIALDHLCKNKACVNPYHLDPVTPEINTTRHYQGLEENTKCRFGHDLPPNRPGWRRHCKVCRNANERRKRAAARNPKMGEQQQRCEDCGQYMRWVGNVWNCVSARCMTATDPSAPEQELADDYARNEHR